MSEAISLSRTPRRVHRLLALCAGLFMLSWAVAPTSQNARIMFAEVSLMAVAALSAAVIFAQSRTRDAWEGTLPYAVAMTVLALSQGLQLASHAGGSESRMGRSTDLVFLLVGALFLLPARTQFIDHFHAEDRSEIAADVALIAMAMISIVYLLLRPDGPDQQMAALVWSAIFAFTAAAALAAFVALALWLPTARHVGQLLVVGLFAGGTLTIGTLWIRGDQAWDSARFVIPTGLGALLLAAIMTWDPAPGERHRKATGGVGRPILTATAILAGSVSLATIAAMETQGNASLPEGSILIVLMAVAIAGRIMVNQVRSRRATETVRHALNDKGAALQNADYAMTQLRMAMDSVAESEEKLRLLFEAAVDGIVELDGGDIIRRSNEAFCQMVGLDRDFILGRSWAQIAHAVPESEGSLRQLTESGTATLKKEGHEMFLEARSSAIPGAPAGKLLLVRDVTAAKVADQTIRSLFKFLQDRDEDRTRLLKRTNSAIEAERNRVARDLHDGPVQGVSAASLSLEAVLLMIKGNDIDGAIDLLVKLREQLSEEADNLRRLMSNMRPPILEERGLVPALEETLTRFGREEDVLTQFKSRSLVEVPADLETLAYRLVQESLTNAKKHARATEVILSLDAVAGQLRVEISDDGVGFDPGMARDYLRAGKVGLASMRERIELANGTFMVRSSPKNGTAIVATLPLDTVPAAIPR
jgi:PAS domain S-box-containing protein